MENDIATLTTDLIILKIVEKFQYIVDVPLPPAGDAEI